MSFTITLNAAAFDALQALVNDDTPSTREMPKLAALFAPLTNIKYDPTEALGMAIARDNELTDAEVEASLTVLREI